MRSTIKTFTNAVLADLETDYAIYEAAQAADTSKTYEISPISFGFDGTNYVLLVALYYPERTLDPLGQVPELP